MPSLYLTSHETFPAAISETIEDIRRGGAHSVTAHWEDDDGPERFRLYAHRGEFRAALKTLRESRDWAETRRLLVA